MDTVSIASKFVDLALKYSRWDGVEKLPRDEEEVLFETVKAAGFEIKGIMPGKLNGCYLDQDGSRTGKTYPINSLCPFKVIHQGNGDYPLATGWLDCLLRLAVSRAWRSEAPRQKIIEAVQAEIERSVPLTPIQLTFEGDMLRECPPSCAAFGSEYFINHTRDEKELGICVGIHAYCCGWMDRHRATATHDAISCRKCNIRILFPREVKTYGELRQELAAKLNLLPGGAS